MPAKGSLDNPERFKNQSYSSLRRKALKSGRPFEDPHFPARPTSLFYKSSAQAAAGVEWKRPSELCASPQLFYENSTAHELVQGQMGDCWMVTACSCMAFHKDIWSKVIPHHRDQDWSKSKPHKHPGIFCFRFWRYGTWTEIVIDDRLPTKNNRLIFCHSKQSSEFWGALVEKAYAKLFGCYEALTGGELAEGLEDFSGGVSENLDVTKFRGSSDKKHNLFSIMKKSWDKNAMMAAAIPAASKAERERATREGLIIGHAYSITAVKRINVKQTGLLSLFKTDKLDMVRLRNPWGGVEWKGAFSDGSHEWKRVSKSERKKLGLTFEDDGEFWMTMTDFERHFVKLCICRVVNTDLLTLEKTWHKSSLHGEWKSPYRAGGCVNNRDNFFNNPQYMFEVSKSEDEVLFSLTQKTSRGSDGQKKRSIGFTILVAETNRPAGLRLHSMTDVATSSPFSNSRSVFLRHTLAKGRYIAVLTTYQPGQEGEFLFRMYSDEEHKGRLLTREAPAKALGCFNCNYPKLVTRVTIVKGSGLRDVSATGCDPYVAITCEGKTFKSKPAEHTCNPEWKFMIMLYRKKPRQPIKIQVFNAGVFKDDFLGQAVLNSDFNRVRNMQYTLRLSGKHENEAVPGAITIAVTSSTDLKSV